MADHEQPVRCSRTTRPRGDGFELPVFRQALPEFDARIVTGETEFDSQQPALAGNRRSQVRDRHAGAAHVFRGDVVFVYDRDLGEAQHADRRTE